MESLRRLKNSCATCGKAGTFACRGCSENFCLPHANEHREGLEKQMHDLTQTHNQLKQAITGQTTEQFRHSLMQQIDQWEQQSIDKVHQVASDIRQQLIITVRDRVDNLKEKLVQLTQQLNKARRDGEFFENDIKDWTEKLDKFQQIFDEQQRIQIYQDKNTTPFISRISLNDDTSNHIFTPPINDIQYDNNRENSIRHHYEDYIGLKEKGEYSKGEHLLRFKIEQYEPNNAILFGIISKIASKDSDVYENPTFFGWAHNNLVYLGGVSEQNYNGYKTDIKTNDVFLLTMNCDRETISLTNERTRRTYDLDVDITKCPFPWILNVRFLAHRNEY
jgi:hypothetical protein